MLPLPELDEVPEELLGEAARGRLGSRSVTTSDCSSGGALSQQHSIAKSVDLSASQLSKIVMGTSTLEISQASHSQDYRPSICAALNLIRKHQWSHFSAPALVRAARWWRAAAGRPRAATLRASTPLPPRASRAPASRRNACPFAVPAAALCAAVPGRLVLGSLPAAAVPAASVLAVAAPCRFCRRRRERCILAAARRRRAPSCAIARRARQPGRWHAAALCRAGARSLQRRRRRARAAAALAVGLLRRRRRAFVWRSCCSAAAGCRRGAALGAQRGGAR